MSLVDDLFRFRPRLHRPHRWWPIAVLAAAAVCHLAAPAREARVVPPNPAELSVRDVNGAIVRPLAGHGQRATVLFFVLPDCPVANGYAPEIGRIITRYRKEGIAGHVVYVARDLPPAAARQHAREYGYADRALLDPEHRLVRAAGATVSPEAVVLSPAGELLYRGRIDDRMVALGQKRAEPARRDLRLALDAIVAGRPVDVARTTAIGCYLSN